MPMRTLTPTQEQINGLRQLFIEKYEKEPPAEPFHPADIDRVINGDMWCKRFLEMYDLDEQTSFDKLWETCMWRREYGTNDLNEDNLRQDYLHDGVIFAHNRDIDGKPLLIFNTKLHAKGSKDMDEVVRVLVYWIERLHRETNLDLMTLFFDMEGTGLSNMDLDFIKRVIDTFKLHYPNALNYILVYEMTWVLNAAFKIVKSLLPEKALTILKIINKKTLNTYVDHSNCLSSWGGSDHYQFSFLPEARDPPAPEAPKEAATAKSNGHLPPSNVAQCDHHDKKVHFANGSPTRMPPPTVQMKDTEEHYTPQDHDMLRISPNDYIKFSPKDSDDVSLEITSVSKFPVTYKIQTTSPEKFRVRPRCGVLKPGESTAVSILLKPDHNLSENARDKFLIMSVVVPQGVQLSPQQVTEFWKQSVNSDSDVEQHRLCCVYKDARIPADTRADSKALPVTSYRESELDRKLRLTQILQCITLVLVLLLSVAVVYLLKLQIGGVATVQPEAEFAGLTCPKGEAL